MNTKSTRARGAAALLLVSAALSAAEPPKEWIEPATGHRVVRLSQEPGASSFYFHQNGYTASGGPAGVGVAVGKAVRTSIVAINVVDFFLSLAIWGATTTVRIAG